MSSGKVGTFPNYPTRGFHPYLGEAYFKFTTVGSGDPTVVTDKANLLDDTLPVERDSAGTYTLHLKDDYQDIVVKSVYVQSTTDHDSIQLEAVSLTRGSQSVTVRAEAAGSANDLTGSVVTVVLGLNLSDK